jgi:hypothetical protein
LTPRIPRVTIAAWHEGRRDALTAHDKTLGRDHDLTKESARITADALHALGRTEEAKALRERYGVTGQGK